MNNSTLVIIKNHIVVKNQQWELCDYFEKADFRITSAKRIFLDFEFYKEFYINLISFPFYEKLCSTYSSGDVIILNIMHNNAIIKVREFIGPTDPKLAEEFHVRFLYGENITLNAVHASENDKDYLREINLIKLYESRLCKSTLKD